MYFMTLSNETKWMWDNEEDGNGGGGSNSSNKIYRIGTETEQNGLRV